MDAMTHTPELMSRLRTYREGGSGRGLLLPVLAAAGVPVQQVLPPSCRTPAAVARSRAASVRSALRCAAHQAQPGTRILDRDRLGGPFCRRSCSSAR